MERKRVVAAYFSANGKTKKAASALAEALALTLDLPLVHRDFTLPAQRESPLVFLPGDLVVLASWVSAGRVPNLLLPYLRTMEGGGAWVLPLVVYGNRAFDDALVELADLAEDRGAHPVGGAALVAQHSFSSAIAGGRPHSGDLEALRAFGRRLAESLKEGQRPDRPALPGNPRPYGGYYQPLGEEGQPVRFLKAVPQTKDSCIDCGLCARLCPLGAISFSDVTQVVGICMKCCACVNSCPVGAKHFTDPAFLSHVAMLEGQLGQARSPAFFPADL